MLEIDQLPAYDTHQKHHPIPLDKLRPVPLTTTNVTYHD